MLNHQQVILPSAHTDASGGRSNMSAVQVILGARQGVPSEDECPSALFGFEPIFNSPAGLRARKRDHVASDTKIFDAHILPTSRQMRIKDNGLVHRIWLNAEDMLDQRKVDAVARPRDHKAAIVRHHLRN